MALSDDLRKRVVEAAFWAAVAQCVDSVLSDTGLSRHQPSSEAGSRSVLSESAGSSSSSSLLANA